jgi:V8-like Glu-specific endopeptidase
MPSRKQRVVEEARRILGSFEGAADAVGAAAGPVVPVDLGLESIDPAGPPMTSPLERQVAEGLDAMRKVDMGLDADISDRDQQGLEAIILLAGRPAILIQEGDFLEPPKLWASLKDDRDRIKDVIGRVGRIEVSNNPNFEWLGTGWLAGKDVVITNRHVAVEFSRRADNGAWTFRAPMGASVNLHAELNSESPLTFTVKSIIGIHEDHDMAALQVEQTSGAERLPDPLPIAKIEPAALKGRKVYVIGYPAWDGRRNDPEPMKRIFADIYNVKRLQPGEISGAALGSFEFFHDCSTLGGNSGSPVLDLETHQVLGLHFGGRFLEKNHAVPLWTLQNDALIKRAAINFQ